MPIVWIPSLMRDLTRGAEKVDVAGGSLRDILTELEATFPGMRERLCDGEGLKPNIAALVDGKSTGRWLGEQVTGDSEIHFLPAISGGATVSSSVEERA